MTSRPRPCAAALALFAVKRQSLEADPGKRKKLIWARGR